MSDQGAPTPPAAEWLTYAQAGERMGLRPEAVAARARRGRWPKRIRNTDGAAEIEVPGELLASGPRKPQEREQDTSPPTDAPDLAGAIQAAMAPLQAAHEAERSALRDQLDRAETDRKVLQAAADVLRSEAATAIAKAVASESAAADAKTLADRERADRLELQRQADLVRQELSAAQISRAEAVAQTNVETAKREATQQRVRDLERQLAELEARPRRRWWPFS